MPGIKESLRSELTASMKARNELRSLTLRMLLTAITNAEVAGSAARTLSEDELTSVLATERKKRQEASAAFRDAGRAELADKEAAEAVIIEEFLPAQLSEDEIRTLVTQTIADLGVGGAGMSAMGKVMGALTPQTRGRADGAVVSAEVRRQLTAG